MSLDDFLFWKNSKNSVGVNTSASSKKKTDVGDVVISPRYNIKKSLIGKDMRRLKYVKVDGKQLSKKDLENVMSRISKLNRRDITYKDLEKFIKDPRRNKIIKGWKNKNKFLAIEKALAKKGIKRSGAIMSDTELAKRKQQNIRSARKINAKSTLEEASFRSPKRSKSKFESSAESSFSRLGITSVKEGYQGGHVGSVGNMNTKKSRSIESHKSQGMVQTGSSDIARNSSRSVESNLRSGAQPRRTGL